ncbi:hypothetical protein [Bacteriophage sp.]|nr:hypothetical protein [Bacteriophage sp.]
MIYGDCPYCDAPMDNPIVDGPLPCFQKLESECCGNVVWLKHSRIDPEAFTEEGFAKEYVIDHKAKTITKRE